VLAWAIVMGLLGDNIIVVFLSFLPVSTVMTYARLPFWCADSMGETRQTADTCRVDSALLPPKGAQCALRCSRVSLPDRG